MLGDPQGLMQFTKDLVTRGLSNLQQQINSSTNSSSRLSTAISQGSASLPDRAASNGDGMALQVASGSSIDSDQARTVRFKQELAGSCINVHQLKRLAFHGVPDNKENLRAVVWKLLLGYLPPSPEDWPKALARKRTQYHVFCDELMLNKKRLSEAKPAPLDLQQQEEEECDQGPLDAVEPVVLDPLQAEDVTSHDHPLSLAQSSQWNMYFQDTEVMIQVERDVLRTHPSMHFFTGDSQESQQHREEIKRALFMYAKLNPGLRYIQGMNELIAPLYYLFKHDPDFQARDFAEADAFWCFMELISEFRDHFCQQLDNTETGIRATIRRLMTVLRHTDESLWRHIELTHKVDPQFYAFRWITLLLAQEFSLPDTLRIWDTILSDPHGRMDCLLRICTALILNVKEQLMKGDFTVIMKTLQRYPPVDINIILHRAAMLPPCQEVLGFRV